MTNCKAKGSLCFFSFGFLRRDDDVMSLVPSLVALNRCGLATRLVGAGQQNLGQFDAWTVATMREMLPT